MLLHNYKRFSPRVKGLQLGLELEIEGRRLPTGSIDGWEVKPDGSLRNGLEYVTRGSVSPEGVKTALTVLSKHLSVSSVRNSIRCSTHVHVNVQDLSLKQIATVMTAYYIVEPLLVEFCGVERKGNLFALRLLDSAAPLNRFMQAAKRGSLQPLGNDDIRYAALNLTSLPRFGTLEYRTMRGIDKDPSEVLPWVDLLVHLHRHCENRFNDPAEVLALFSALGPRQFAERVLGRDDLFDPALENDMYESARIAQWFAYQLEVVVPEKKPQQDEEVNLVFEDPAAVVRAGHRNARPDVAAAQWVRYEGLVRQARPIDLEGPDNED